MNLAELNNLLNSELTSKIKESKEENGELLINVELANIYSTILFIIFDLEIAFLFPWAISLGNIGILGFWSMMIFLAILTIGFIYEWKKGALEWE